MPVAGVQKDTKAANQQNPQPQQQNQNHGTTSLWDVV